MVLSQMNDILSPMRFNRLPLSALLVSLCGFLFFSCGSRKDFGEPYVKKARRVQPNKVYANSYTNVWESAVETMNENNFALLVSQRNQGLIITDWIIEKSDTLFSGYGDAKIPYKIRYKMQINIAPTRRGVEVKIKSREQYLTDVISSGMEFQGSIYRWLDVDSSGSKESKVLDKIAQKLSVQQK